jgi:Ulp1 family protease
MRSLITLLLEPFCEQRKPSLMASYVHSQTPEQMKVRYRVAMVDDGVKILLIPIFSGDITCGHYSLAVVDRLRCTLLYFGSLPALDDEIGPITLKRLVDKGFADTKMVQGIYVAGGDRGMIKQGMNTNDCGVFTCCLASAYVKAATGGSIPTGMRSLQMDGILKVGFTKKGIDATRWGQYGRRHIGDTIKKSQINMMDDAVTSILMSSR